MVKNLTRAKYHDYQIETEIKQVIKLLVEEEFNEAPTNILNLTALKLDQKANKTLNGITKRKIRNEITDYYLYIKQQFKQLDKQYPNSFDVIATQIKSFYLIISRSETSQEVIYEQLTEWLSKKQKIAH